MKRAFCLIREQPWYRREAFECGIQAAGYTLVRGEPTGAPGDVLLIWNRYGHWAQAADQFEARGGRVIVAENGYLGRGGSTPKFDVHPAGPKPEHYYAISLGGHNGSGETCAPSDERWAALGVDLKPWRETGEHVLVCPSRSFGTAQMTMPKDWTARTVAELRRHTRRPIRVREHPLNNAPTRPLAEDLDRAWAVVIWASTAGVHALVAGIPVVCEAPRWICKPAAGDSPADVENESRVTSNESRLLAMHRLASAQWQLNEIESGEPFRRLLGD